ncbi:phage tail protein [Lysinibacillus contaminans]|uniref:phage tail protein n=1 Tax=Lysinibacillus contaminans TaxID=1293441 RepID=UPI0006AFE464|nr:phage tail protein [Lysinibacillus contaminans]
MSQYGTLITNIGLAQIANAQITQSVVGLSYIALGDGNGSHYVPTQNQTALVKEVWRGPIAEKTTDPTNDKRIIIDAVIPVTAGGFTIREIGIFDDENRLIAIGQYPEKYKPQLSEGVSEETIIHFVIETSNADVIKLTIDPTVIIASRPYVDAKVAQVQTALTEHSAESVAGENGAHDLRYFNDKLEFNDGSIWNEIETGSATKAFVGDLNNLVENGYYSTDNPLNAPTGGKWLISVLVSSNGKTIWQEARAENQNRPNDNFFRRLGLKGDDGVVAWGVPQSGIPGYLNGWKYANLNLSNDKDSISQTAAATSYAISQKANKQQGNWINVVLSGGTPDITYPPQYYKDDFGEVHVAGRVKGTYIAFQMPVGYIPQKPFVAALSIASTIQSTGMSIQENGYFVANMTQDNLYTFNFSYRAREV